MPAVRERLRAEWPEVRVLGTGQNLRVLKDTGRPTDTCARYGIARSEGYLAVAHTRMATESAVTVLHSHPFVPARDLCVVHNGSFSNYATVRRRLEADGVRFDSDNDSEVAARFLAQRLEFGDDLEEATRWVMKEMDGFFTLVITNCGRHVGRARRLCLQAGGRGRDAGLRRGGLGVPGAGRAARYLDGHRLRAPTRGGLHVEPLTVDRSGLGDAPPTRRPLHSIAPFSAPAA